MNKTPVPKTVHTILRPAGRHWVGNGFPVQSLFSYAEHGVLLSPFLLLDYASPVEFTPTKERRGVSEHPHRGFETVTIVYHGEVEHRDSAGGGGTIGPGDVQWMTAASGLVHEEFHGRDFARRGGAFQMVQLWVNLPAKDKMSRPRYQGLTDQQIPAVELPDCAGTVRVIAGAFGTAAGPAETFTPMNVWDLRLQDDRPVDLEMVDGWTTALVVLEGTLRVNASEPIAAAEVAVMERTGTSLRLQGAGDAKVLLLAGEPIAEPIVGSGPFVMNTQQEIRQAYADYQSGEMGQL